MNRKFLIPLAVVASVTGFFGAVSASSGSTSAPDATEKSVPSGVSGPKLKRVGAVYPIQFVFFVTDTSETKQRGNWRRLPGDTTITVPVGGDNAVIFSRFTAESLCTGRSGYCSARIGYRRLPDGQPSYMEPNAGRNLAFDSSGGGDAWESHSIEQVIANNVGVGDYQVWVEISSQAFAGSSRRPLFTVDNWTFSTQAAW